jgi:hypothetical protein
MPQRERKQTMNFHEIAITRSSCRKYDTTRAIPEEALQAVLDSAALAPSACNSQPYLITVCRGETVGALARAKNASNEGINDFVADADTVLVISEQPVVVSPVMEEFVFRRCIMNRLLPYGEKAALITSTLIFALFHAAANQVCYAFLLGLVFGYVYIRTGRLRYSMILHVIINTMTSIILPALLILVEGSLSGISPSQVQLVSVITHPGVLALLLYVAGLFVLFLFGAVVFFFGVREREMSPDGVRMKTVFSSWGIILFL